MKKFTKKELNNIKGNGTPYLSETQPRYQYYLHNRTMYEFNGDKLVGWLTTTAYPYEELGYERVKDA